MSRTSWIRLGSLAAIISGAIATLFASLSLTVAIAQILAQNLPLGVDLFPVSVVSWGGQVLVVLYIPALIGVRVRGASRAGSLGWISITCAILGAIVAAWATYYLGRSCIRGRKPLQPPKCNFNDPDRYLLMGYMEAELGSVIPAIGMILYGIVALRRRLLPRHNWLLPAIGLTLLLDIANPQCYALFWRLRLFRYPESGNHARCDAARICHPVDSVGRRHAPTRQRGNRTQDVPTPVEPAV